MAEAAVVHADLDARSIIRSKARTFYLASLFLPARLRPDVYVVYAFYRTVDDLVDEPPSGWTRFQTLQALDGWRRELENSDASAPGLVGRLHDVVQRHAIPIRYLFMILEGARFDVDMKQIETREELHRYSVLMAGSVGMVMAHILGARHESAMRAACNLGVAMQLTNVLRDVGEDLGRGRVYIPADDLRGAGLSVSDLEARRVTPALSSIVEDIACEARVLYRTGLAGVAYLEPATQFSIHLAANLYSRILVKIEQNRFDVLSRRAHLGWLEKWALALPTYVKHRHLAVGR